MKRYTLPNGVERIDFVSLPGQPVFAMKATTNPNHQRSQANTVVQSIIGKMALVAKETHRVAGDARLSPRARAAKLEPIRKETKASIERAFSILDQERQKTEISRNKLFAVPDLKGDAAQAIYDQEIRARIAAMPVNSLQRTKLNEEIAAGKNDRALLALLREPIDTPDKLWAQAIHDQRVTKDNADAVKALDEEAEFVEHANTAIASLSNILDKSSRTEILTDTTPESQS